MERERPKQHGFEGRAVQLQCLTTQWLAGGGGKTFALCRMYLGALYEPLSSTE